MLIGGYVLTPKLSKLIGDNLMSVVTSAMASPGTVVSTEFTDAFASDCGKELRTAYDTNKMIIITPGGLVLPLISRTITIPVFAISDQLLNTPGSLMVSLSVLAGQQGTYRGVGVRSMYMS